MKREATSGIIGSMSARPYSQCHQDVMSEIAPADHPRMVTVTLFVDPREFGLTKVAYSVGEVLEQLSIGRTALYAAVKRRELTPVKFGRKTLFYATDFAAFLARLRQARTGTNPTARPISRPRRHLSLRCSRRHPFRHTVPGTRGQLATLK